MKMCTSKLRVNCVLGPKELHKLRRVRSKVLDGPGAKDRVLICHVLVDASRRYDEDSSCLCHP